MKGWTTDREAPSRADFDLPAGTPSATGTGAYSPEISDDARGELDLRAIHCAVCGAFIVDYTKIVECWGCGQTNFLGDP
jgi:hypothetical protein